MKILSEFPSLIIVLPIILGVIGVIIDSTKFSKYSLLVLHLVMAAFLFKMFPEVSNKLEIKYSFGGWDAPYGIEFVINRQNLLLVSLLYFVSLMTLAFSWKDLSYFTGVTNYVKFISVYMINLAGFSGMLLTNDLFNLYVFIEIASISAYALSSMGGKNAIKAGADYLIIGTFAATLILFGIGLIYSTTGTLNMTDILSSQSVKQDDNLIIYSIGLAFIVCGLFVKFALFPFHKWMIGIYENSNYFTTILFSAISTKVMLFVFFKIYFGLKESSLIDNQKIGYYFMGFASVSVIVMGIVTLFQKKIRSTLAYSSASQIGYILIAILFSIYDGANLFLSFLIVHSLSKLGLFMIASLLDKSTFLRSKGGISLSVIVPLFVMSASIIGIPGTAGFIVKMNLFLVSIKQSYLFMSAIIIMGSVIALFYMWPVVEDAYTQYSQQKITQINVYPNQKFVLYVLTLIIVAIGIYPEFLNMIIVG
ncbi:MAG: proton-conducting transporter membrane subunit [Rickettsiales bacterium]